MATYNFQPVPVYGQVGTLVRFGAQAGATFPTTKLDGTSATVVQGGVTKVGYVEAGSDGKIPAFSTTDIPSVLIDFGLGQLTVHSQEAITAGASSAAAAAASATVAEAARDDVLTAMASEVARADAAYVPVQPDHTYIHPRFGRYWYTALAGGSTKPVVAVVGDSIAKKFNASSVANSWVGKLRTDLQTTYTDGGLGFVGMADAGSGSGTFLSGFWSQYATDDRVALTGTWTLSPWKSSGPGMTIGSSTVAASTASFRVRGSTLNVYFLGVTSAGGTFSVSIDGGGATSYTTGSKPANAILKQQVATGLSTGWHTVLVTLVSGGVNLCGVSGENNTGVVVNNFSRGGATTLTAVDLETGGENTAAWNGGVKYPCNLLIYALGVNDFSPSTQGTLASTSEANARKLINAVREQTANSNGSVDVLFVINHIGDVTTRDPSMGYHDLVARWHDLAATYNGAVVDVWSRFDQNYARAATSSFWGDTATVGIAGTDTLHPSNAGHQAIFDLVRPVVIP